MNIFVLDLDPQKAAICQCDKHVVKMVLESAQMLCSALWRHDIEAPYKAAYTKHPCTVWAGDTRANFKWLALHALSLLEEYEARYHKKHKSEHALRFAYENRWSIPYGTLTDFAQAMPDQYKDPDPVIAYRRYYLGEKMGFATWKRNRPFWVPPDAEEEKYDY